MYIYHILFVHNSVLEHFHHFKNLPCACLQLILILTPSPRQLLICFRLYKFTFFNHSYKQNHKICSLLHLVSFILEIEKSSLLLRHGPSEVLSSVQFSPSVVSDSLQPHELKHTRLPYPSPTPGVCSHSCPSSQ